MIVMIIAHSPHHEQKTLEVLHSLLPSRTSNLSQGLHSLGTSMSAVENFNLVAVVISGKRKCPTPSRGLVRSVATRSVGLPALKQVVKTTSL